MTIDQNEWFRSLNAGLPDDVARLKAAGYYEEAIARIDALLAEDWTAVQNGPNTGANPAPAMPDAQREALLAQREILRRLPAEYIYTKQQAVEKMQAQVTGFTLEELRALERAGRVDWRFVEGEKHYKSTISTALTRRCWLPTPPLPPGGVCPSRTAARPSPAGRPPTKRCCGRAPPRPASRWRPAWGCRTPPLPRRWPGPGRRDGTPSTSGPGCPCLPPVRASRTSAWNTSRSRPPMSRPRTRPSAPPSGRRTWPRTAASPRGTATPRPPAMPTRWALPPTRTSPVSTPARKPPTSSLPPTCGRWPPS